LLSTCLIFLFYSLVSHKGTFLASFYHFCKKITFHRYVVWSSVLIGTAS